MNSIFRTIGYRAHIHLAFVAIALFALLGPSYENIGSKCLQVASLIGWLDLLFGRRRVLKSWPFYLLWAALLVQIISWLLCRVYAPDIAESSPKLHRLGVWFQFLPVAWILAGSYQKSAVVLALGALGLCLAPWLSGGGWQELQQGLLGERVDFALSNAQHTSLYYACGFLVVVTLGAYLHQGQGWRMWIGRATRLLLGAVFLIGVVVSQTRGIWLALVITLVLLGVWLTWNQGGAIHPIKRARYALISVVAIVAALIVLSQSQHASRLYTSVSQVAHPTTNVTSLAAPQDQSAALRVHLWFEGWQWVQQKPLFGWGGAGRKHASVAADLPPQFSGIQHLHSSYIDTLVNYGLAGLLMFIGLLVWFVWAPVTAYHKLGLPRPWCALAIAWISLWVIANFFESYMYFSSGNYLTTLLGGVLASQIWRHQGFFEAAKEPGVG